MSLYWQAKTGDVQGPGNATDTSLQQSVGNLSRRFGNTYLTPVTASTTATLTPAQLIGTILVSAPASNISLTSPTAAALVAADPDAAVGRGYSFYVVNTNGTNTVTVVAGTGVTLVGNVVTAISSSSHYYVSYTNVTLGTEAVTVYRLAV